jgi:hypothetical protein
MAIVVIGGHSRNVGKTSVVAGIIAALPEMNWTALKITQFGHGVCSVTTEPCDCALVDTLHAWSITEEGDRSGETDTSRFLVSGAKRSLWVRTKQGMLAEAMPDVREELRQSENAIIESNSIMKFIRPDIYISVLDFGTKDFKDSAREFLDRANAVIIHETTDGKQPEWANVSLKLIEGKLVLRVKPPQYVNESVVNFVRERLTERAAAR